MTGAGERARARFAVGKRLSGFLSGSGARRPAIMSGMSDRELLDTLTDFLWAYCQGCAAIGLEALGDRISSRRFGVGPSLAPSSTPGPAGLI